MYQAEIQGKLASEVARSEDLLTSNVFSFFKYADRETYLRALLGLIGLEVSEDDLDSAEFKFWPSYDDKTEPDVVLMVGDYYILFEAKYKSGFGRASGKRLSQLERELSGGLHEARAYGKAFVPVAITAHSSRPFDAFANIPGEFADRLKWINWQSIASLLLGVLERAGSAAPDFDFAADLYALLEKKMLRGFLNFDRLEDAYTFQAGDYIFFSPESATFRGDFIGFRKALSTVVAPDFMGTRIFFRRRYFQSPRLTLPQLDESQLFWKERR